MVCRRLFSSASNLGLELPAGDLKEMSGVVLMEQTHGRREKDGPGKIFDPGSVTETPPCGPHNINIRHGSPTAQHHYGIELIIQIPPFRNPHNSPCCMQ